MHDGIDGNYLMAIINSRLFVFIYRLLALEAGRVLAQVKPGVFYQLPMYTPNYHSDTPDKERYDEIVTRVKAMLETKKQLAKLQAYKDKNYYENKCASLDKRIDRLVYDF